MRLEHIHAATGRFLNKANRVNEGFTNYKQSQQYKLMRGLFADAIRQQADDVAEAIREHGVANMDVVNGNFTPLWRLIEEPVIAALLRHSYDHAVNDLYGRMRMRKATKTDAFQLHNPQYIARLNDQANYLLHRSSIDDTTRDQMIATVAKAAEEGTSYYDVATALEQGFDSISNWRSDMIARTELANAMGTAQMDAMRENGIGTKSWVVAGDGCPICDENEDAGFIGVNDMFPSGDDSVPAHPNCECYIEPGDIDLSAIDLWGGE